ncbi:hypothetical protein JTE90_025404 [Oedothorax gibbosus]|uniref:Uncharacterized protein n=1 Tax=Oedothorax gibbosus TaxID=931172 RepID=A0AAV6ULJ6_9ARAC|nr:hypothetical protein JTE90_025404 [Oedothorax gibbosus]
MSMLICSSYDIDVVCLRNDINIIGGSERASPSSLSKRGEWEGDSGHLSDYTPRGSQTLKRPRSQRHHTVGFETGSMTTLPRGSMDLEADAHLVLWMIGECDTSAFDGSSE